MTQIQEGAGNTPQFLGFLLLALTGVAPVWSSACLTCCSFRDILNNMWLFELVLLDIFSANTGDGCSGVSIDERFLKYSDQLV